MSENTYIREYGGLRATSLDRKGHERTCGYWYVVTNGATPHTAFRTRDEVDVWLYERGLSLAQSLPDAGTWATTEITGSYRTSMDRDAARFGAIDPILVTKQMDNGVWTLAKVTEDDGVRTVHFMNVNYR
jgi:hypothetical protein